MRVEIEFFKYCDLNGVFSREFRFVCVCPNCWGDYSGAVFDSSPFVAVEIFSSEKEKNVLVVSA